MKPIPFRLVKNRWNEEDKKFFKNALEFFSMLYINHLGKDFAPIIQEITEEIKKELDLLDRQDSKGVKERKVVVRWGKGRTAGEEG